MIINWHGNGCFRAQTPDFSLLVDPETSASGNRLKADLILHTSSKAPFAAEEAEIVGPGEYNINGVKIKGVLSSAESNEKEIKSVYKAVIDDINLGFFGDIKAPLTEEALESLGEVDILFVAGDSPEASRYIKILEPKIVVPSGDPKKLMSDLGQKPEIQEKIVIKKREIEEIEGAKLIILKS